MSSVLLDFYLSQSSTFRPYEMCVPVDKCSYLKFHLFNSELPSYKFKCMSSTVVCIIYIIQITLITVTVLTS